MFTLMTALLTWIGAHSPYGGNLPLPNVVFLERYAVCAAYGISGQGNCNASGLYGFYDRDLTIYLRAGFDPSDPSDQSRLLHELVHYLQWASGRNRESCRGRLEVEAHDLQDAWRAERGLAPTLDVFRRILLNASCDA